MSSKGTHVSTQSSKDPGQRLFAAFALLKLTGFGDGLFGVALFCRLLAFEVCFLLCEVGAGRARTVVAGTFCLTFPFTADWA